MLCLIWCWFRLPETKDRSFGEIDLLFEHKVAARKFRTTVVDQFSVDEERKAGMQVEEKGNLAHIE